MNQQQLNEHLCRRLFTLAAAREMDADSLLAEWLQRENVQQLSTLSETQMLHAVAEGIVAVNLESEVIFWNRSMEEISGWMASETLDRPVLELTITNAAQSEVQAALDQLREGNPWSGELLLQHRDGKLIEAEITARPILDNVGQPVALISTVKDITRQKQSQRARAASEKRLQSVINNAPIILWQIDAEGNFLFLAGEAIDQVDWEAGDLEGRNVFDLYADERRLLDFNEKVLRGKRATARLEIDGRIWDGHYEPQWDDDGRLIGAIGVAVDISKRSEAEAAAAKHMRRTEILADLSRDLARAGLRLSSVLDTTVQEVAQAVGDACVLTLLAHDETWFEPVAFYHSDPETRRLMTEILGERPRSPQSDALEQVRQKGESILIPELSPEQRQAMIRPEYREYAEKIGVYSMVIVPLHAGEEVIGTLGVTRDSPGRPYSDEDETFMRSVAERAAMAIENARLYSSLERSRARLRQLTRQMITRVEDERRRLALELHDEVGQTMTALKINLEKATREAGSAPLKQQLTDTITLADQSLERVRQVARNLRPTELEALGLIPALAGLCEDLAEHGEVKVEFAADPVPKTSDLVNITLYRILQEALTNVVRHAYATRVTVQLSATQSTVRLEIKDNGIGFHADRLRSRNRRHAGMGLSGMRERLNLLNGTLQIRTAPDEGTHLQVVIPQPPPGVKGMGQKTF